MKCKKDGGTCGYGGMCDECDEAGLSAVEPVVMARRDEMVDTKRLEFIAANTGTINRNSDKWDGNDLFYVEWFDKDYNTFRQSIRSEDFRECVDNAMESAEKFKGALDSAP